MKDEGYSGAILARPGLESLLPNGFAIYYDTASSMGLS
jgi:hypothetical protein